MSVLLAMSMLNVAVHANVVNNDETTYTVSAKDDFADILDQIYGVHVNFTFESDADFYGIIIRVADNAEPEVGSIIFSSHNVVNFVGSLANRAVGIELAKGDTRSIEYRSEMPLFSASSAIASITIETFYIQDTPFDITINSVIFLDSDGNDLATGEPILTGQGLYNLPMGMELNRLFARIFGYAEIDVVEIDEDEDESVQAEEPEQITDTWVWNLPINPTDEDLLFAEIEHFRFVRDRPHAYDYEWLLSYFSAMNPILRTLQFTEEISDATIQQLHAAIEIRQNKIQTLDNPEESVWYIWGDSMPTASEFTEDDFRFSFDGEDFRPFLVPFLAEDSLNARGNIIILAGGAFEVRANFVEGFPTAEAFRALGYNAFVLQYRVAPYSSVHASVDLQRAIRYIVYNAEKYELGGIDNIATVGFSAGAMTILAQVRDFYGDVQLDALFPDYIPDTVDEVNADYSVMVIIYGARPGFETDNPNIPSALIIHGRNDTTVGPAGAIDLFEQLSSLVPTELIIFADAPHGFGLGNGVPGLFDGFHGVDQWLRAAETFLRVEFGQMERRYEP